MMTLRFDASIRLVSGRGRRKVGSGDPAPL